MISVTLRTTGGPVGTMVQLRLSDQDPAQTYSYSLLIFFFQAEDGIRDYKVTGVQTCALPICVGELLLDEQMRQRLVPGVIALPVLEHDQAVGADGGGAGGQLGQHRQRAEEIGRASCRERV